MKKNQIALFVVAMAAAIPLAVFGDGEITATASPVRVDMRTGVVAGVVGAANLRYSPDWAATNASVRMEFISGSTTNVIKTGSVGEEGTLVWSQPDAAVSTYRLLLWTMQNGAAVGAPISAFVSFGFQSASAALAVADTRTNSLQQAVYAGGPVNLAYSTAWAADASAINISAVKLSGRGGTAEVTNAMFSAVADAEGRTAMSGVSAGWWRLLCQATDSSGNVLLEYLTDEFRQKGGFVLNVR